MPQIPLGQLMVASTILGIASVSFLFTTIVMPQPADMRVEPRTGASVIGDTFTVRIVIESREAVNVFKGLMRFEPQYLEVAAIDYNTSIADLWAEEPWYSNGDGTLNFIGGTTKPGGFTGTDTLITVTFMTKAVGETSITMDEVRILLHDGLGTDALVETPIDAIFTIDETTLQEQMIIQKSVPGSRLVVQPETPRTDLNGDEKQSIVDISIFMTYLALQDPRADFNLDGRVSLADLSVLMNTK